MIFICSHQNLSFLPTGKHSEKESKFGSPSVHPPGRRSSLEQTEPIVQINLATTVDCRQEDFWSNSKNESEQFMLLHRKRSQEVEMTICLLHMSTSPSTSPFGVAWSSYKIYRDPEQMSPDQDCHKELVSCDICRPDLRRWETGQAPKHFDSRGLPDDNDGTPTDRPKKDPQPKLLLHTYQDDIFLWCFSPSPRGWRRPRSHFFHPQPVRPLSPSKNDHSIS